MIKRRFSFSTMSVSGDNGDIDSLLSNLYPDHETLERKCLASITTDLSVDIMPTISTTKSRMDQPIYEKSPEAVVEELSESYFDPNFDPVEPHLIEMSDWVFSDFSEKFMGKIEDADMDKDIIIGHLTNMIDENYGDLVDCMHNVQSIDVDLCKAGIQISHGRRKIRSACDIIHSGAIKIKNLSEQRKKLENITETIKSVKALKDIYKAMQNSINTGEIGKAAEFAKNVLQCLKNESFDRFIALNNIGKEIQQNICKIRTKTDKALKRLCCRKFASIDYENILKSYLILDNLTETMGVRQFNDISDRFIQDTNPCLDGLPQRINRFQLEDIDSCLHTAVMEFIYAGQQKKQKQAKELSIQGAYMQMNLGEIVDLAEVPLKILYSRLSSDMVAPCVVRSCELLADVIHTHYLITQWHTSPFSKENRNKGFLHRCPIDLTDLGEGDSDHEEDNDDDPPKLSVAQTDDSDMDALIAKKEDEENDETPSKTAKTHALEEKKRKMNVKTRLSDVKSTSILSSFEENFTQSETEKDLLSPNSMENEMYLINNNDRATRLNGVKLTIVYQQLAESRTILWEETLRALSDILTMISLSLEVKVDEFLAMTWALHSMIRLGKEFCNSDSKVLQSSLKRKTEEYFQNFHMNAFYMVKQMIEAETWICVPIDVSVEREGGILGIILNTLSRDSMAAGLVHCDPSAKSKKSTGSHSMNTKFTRRASTVLKNRAEVNENDEKDSKNTHNSSENSILMQFASKGNPFHFMTNANNDDEEDKEQMGEKESNGGSTGKNKGKDGFWELMSEIENEKDNKGGNVVVVTQTALNALTKHVGKYMHMMYLLPSSAPEVFVNMCHLFDYYLCAIFQGFMPVEEKSRFFAKNTKLTATAPDMSKTYEELQQYLERTMDEVVYSSRNNLSQWYPNTQKPNPNSPQTLKQHPTQNPNHRHSNGSLNSETTHDSTIQVSESQTTGGTDHNSRSSSPFSQAGNSGKHSSNGKNSGFMGGGRGLNAGEEGNSEVVKISSLLVPIQAVMYADSSSCFALDERIVAAESCTFVAKILKEISPKVCKLLPEESLELVNKYVSEFQIVAEQLRNLIYRAICPQLLKHNLILPMIVDSGWDSKKLIDTNHDWVLKLIQHCKEVWDFQNSHDRFAEASTIIKEEIWLEICQSAFDIVLEGYSRVRKCSAEGRAAMTMDIVALHEGLNKIHLCRPPRGKHHIDNYLRTTYMSEEDMLQWVRENWTSYAYRHIHGLLSQTLTTLPGGNRKLKEATLMIDGLYEVEPTTSSTGSGISLSGMSKLLHREDSSGGQPGGNNAGGRGVGSRRFSLAGSISNTFRR